MPAFIRLQNPPPLEFELPDGRAIIIPSPPRQRLEEASGLTLPGEYLGNPAASAAIVSQALEILCGPTLRVRSVGVSDFADQPTSETLASIPPALLLDIYVAVDAHSNGTDPAMVIAVNHALTQHIRDMMELAGTEGAANV